MGINISATKVVSLDDTHERLVDTSLANNPKLHSLNSLPVYAIFQRNRTGDKDRDGSPLVYALKGIKKYTISVSHEEHAYKRARDIVPQCLASSQADYVIPIMSKYAVSSRVAQLVSEVSGIPFLNPDFLRKKTVGEMLEEHDGNVPSGLNARNEHMFKQQLHTWGRMPSGTAASMKEIDTKIRHCFAPITICGAVEHLRSARVIVVDDLMSSGASLACVSSLLTTQCGCHVERAVCLLSPL
ncbi:hypothetical protein EV667_1347 [Ancylobacter aquaticus]|uniref:Phosphoribosyltransferase domain-containing protein n=1 Tax=Ancylobacter aquaticus TaxID=100 RepID=A0A4R1IAB2_ANCAQ|nr:hypothetical protein EV667_1347 [Ancylobacter aquaticus]